MGRPQGSPLQAAMFKDAARDRPFQRYDASRTSIASD
jgi:hypothetical protein